MIDKKYIKILRDVKSAGWKSAVIAGGAVRDAYFKQKHKDVDIFLYEPSFSNEKPMLYSDPSKLFTTMGLIKDDEEFTFKPDSSYYTGKGLSLISKVWTLETDDDTYQLIFVDVPPIEFVTKFFDMGICMCYFDGERVRYTHEFLQDARNKTLTICGQLTQSEFHKTIGGHVRTLKRKFPGFKIVVAPHLQHWVTPKIQQYLKTL